jgi:hypothetical protein
MSRARVSKLSLVASGDSCLQATPLEDHDALSKFRHHNSRKVAVGDRQLFEVEREIFIASYHYPSQNLMKIGLLQEMRIRASVSLHVAI